MMGMATFLLELVSPEKLLLSRQVEMATLPGVEGEMGVLPGHSPMIVALKGGLIRVRENGSETEKLFEPFYRGERARREKRCGEQRTWGHLACNGQPRAGSSERGLHKEKRMTRLCAHASHLIIYK